MHKRIFSYITLTAHSRTQCGPFTGPKCWEWITIYSKWSISYIREIRLTNREKRKAFEVIFVVCLRTDIPLFLSIMLHLSLEGNVTLLPTASAEWPIISSSNRSLQAT